MCLSITQTLSRRRVKRSRIPLWAQILKSLTHSGSFCSVQTDYTLHFTSRCAERGLEKSCSCSKGTQQSWTHGIAQGRVENIDFKFFFCKTYCKRGSQRHIERGHILRTYRFYIGTNPWRLQPTADTVTAHEQTQVGQRKAKSSRDTPKQERQLCQRLGCVIWIKPRCIHCPTTGALQIRSTLYSVFQQRASELQSPSEASGKKNG